LPATGAIARTATNIRAGGRTPVAGIMHAAFLLGFMFFGSKLMKLVPMATLAAILFVVAWGMSEYERFIHLLKLPSDDRAVLLLTLGLTVLVDLTVAIAVGVILSSLTFMARMAKTVEIGTGQSPAAGNGNGEDVNQRAHLPAGVEVFRITGPLFFGVASELLDTLRRIGQPPKVFIVRMRLVPFLDTTGAEALRRFVEECLRLGIQVIFSGVQAQPMVLLAAAGLGLESRSLKHAPDYEAALDMAGGLLRVNAGAETAPAQ
jgi:SulP family sulfate permease